MGTHPIFESDFDCLTEQSSPFASMGARGPPNIDGMVSLKVDNLSYRTSTETLRRKFERYGEIGDCYVPRDRNTGDSRGFGFVRFFDKRDAADAVKGLDGYDLDGRDLRVDYARHERPQTKSGGRDGGRGGGGGRGRDRSRSRSRSRGRGRGSRSRSRSRSGGRSRRSRASRSGSREAARRSRSRSPADRRDRSRSPADKKSRSKSRSQSK